MDKLVILQHNVQHWGTRNNHLINIYREINPDVILLNSHGTKEEDSIRIHNYTTYKVNSTNSVSDGSAILVRKGLNHRLIDNFVTDVLSVKIETSLGWIQLATTYLPPRRPYLPFPDFHQLLYDNEPTYILGDLNAKHSFLGDRTENQVGKGLNRFLNNNKLVHLGPNFPTFLSHNSATAPDLVLSNDRTYHNTKIETGPLTSSDHIPVIMTITARVITEPRKNKLVYKRADWNKFREIIQTEIQEVREESEQEGIENVDNRLQSWYDVVAEGMRQAIPTTNRVLVAKPICNDNIKTIQKEFNTLLNFSRRNGWTLQSYARYRELKQLLVKECQKCYRRNWESEITHLADTYKDPTKFWQKIKKIRGVENTQTPYILDAQQNKIYDSAGKENIFRNIWSNVFKITDEENQEFDDENENLVLEYLAENWQRTTPTATISTNVLTGATVTESKITVNEIKVIIKRCKNTAPGFSNINKTVLDELPESALSYLVNIFNDALTLGYFPDQFKSGIINLIPKGSNSPLNPCNYRPITLLDVPGKIFERAINYRLKHHLIRNNLIPESQHGFREGRGTNTALTIITETIAQSVNRKQQCHIILRDVSKAFDKVWHNGLKYKILQLGLPPHMERILCDYLCDRTVNIRINNTIGPSIDILSGVPQGGILSPTMYTIYTRDIPLPSVDSYDILYADDVTQLVIHNGKSKRAMSYKVSKEIERINKFEKKWKIKTNQSKFTVIPLASKRNEDIIADGEYIETCKEGKTLGLKITSNGYLKHVQEILKRGERAIHSLIPLRKLPEKIKTHLVKAYILPIIEYPAIPLCALSRTQVGKLQKMQNRALRFAMNDCYPYQWTTEELHRVTKTKTMNVKLHERAQKIWNKVVPINNPIMTQLDNNQPHRNHAWFPSARYVVTRNIPEPLYS